jgi:hypothetical protein
VSQVIASVRAREELGSWRKRGEADVSMSLDPRTAAGDNCCRLTLGSWSLTGNTGEPCSAACLQSVAKLIDEEE